MVDAGRPVRGKWLTLTRRQALASGTRHHQRGSGRTDGTHRRRGRPDERADRPDPAPLRPDRTARSRRTHPGGLPQLQRPGPGTAPADPDLPGTGLRPGPDRRPPRRPRHRHPCPPGPSAPAGDRTHRTPAHDGARHRTPDGGRHHATRPDPRRTPRTLRRLRRGRPLRGGPPTLGRHRGLRPVPAQGRLLHQGRLGTAQHRGRGDLPGPGRGHERRAGARQPRRDGPGRAAPRPHHPLVLRLHRLRPPGTGAAVRGRRALHRHRRRPRRGAERVPARGLRRTSMRERGSHAPLSV